MSEFSYLKSHFLLRPDITFLNNGSFGACPRPIFEDYQKWQRELEEEPVQFIAVNGLEYLKKSRQALGGFVNADPEDLVYVVNPSHAINIIAKSFPLSAGDEILATDLEYGALDRTWKYYCNKSGAKYLRQKISLPIVSKEKFIEDFFSGLSSKTKAIFISHITSSTALVFPVKEICDIAKSKGIFTIVDGAHAPNHVPIDLSTLKADVYTGAAHKWMLTAKGSSFLYVAKEHQHLFDPLVISWGYDSAVPSSSLFLDYHQTQGTRDYSAFLTIPKALEYIKEHQWDKINKWSRTLAHANYIKFCELLGTAPLCPIGDEFLGQMCSIPIQTAEPEKLQKLLFDEYKIEIPVMRHDDKVYLRYSIQAFNTQSDLDKLYSAVEEIKKTNLLN